MSEVTPVCPKCGGSGWLVVEHKTVSSVTPCECRFEGRVARMEERAQIPPLYRDKSIDNFRLPENDSRTLKNVLLSVNKFISEFPMERCPGLLLVGEPGTGKTHLAVAALRKIIERGFEGLFWDYQILLNSIRAGFDATSNSSDREAYRAALDSDVLLLDDLGAQRVTDWAEDTVCSIITHRCNYRKPLIATTNLPDPDAGSDCTYRGPLGVEYRKTLEDHIGKRARSRLFEMCTVIRIPATEDYRVQKARKF